MYEEAEPVRTPQAGSDRKQPSHDPPGRLGNTNGHVHRGKQACHEYKGGQGTSSNVYEEAEVVKLENISGDVPYGTDTSTDTDTTQHVGARVYCMVAALAVVVALAITGPILLMFINEGYNHEERVRVTVVVARCVSGKEVPVVECATYLGFKRHRSLGWDSQILHMAKKGSIRLHFLRMLKKGGMPPEDLETVYTTLIRPVLEYANVVYVGCNTKQNNTLEAVQRRAARIIYGNSTQTTLFSTLQDRRETAAKTLLKKMRHVSHPLHSLMPCDRHQSTRRSLRNGNHFSVPNRLEPKNRKDRGHPVANLAARPSATSDNVNKHLHKRPHVAARAPRSVSSIVDQRIAETLCDDCHFSLSCFHPGAVMSDVSAPAGPTRHDNKTLIDGTCVPWPTSVNGYLTSVGESRIEVTLWRRMAAAQTLATDISHIPTTVGAFNLEHKQNQTAAMEQRLTEKTGRRARFQLACSSPVARPCAAKSRPIFGQTSHESRPYFVFENRATVAEYGRPSRELREMFGRPSFVPRPTCAKFLNWCVLRASFVPVSDEGSTSLGRAPGAHKNVV
ncbi:hypothetical protein Bbelb_387890 [Branchiostoma belcheri]|nr:hypothetical protein Bbelb_387890 [Branchiostoma belcheri]